MPGRCIQILMHRDDGKIALDQRALEQVLLHPNAEGRRISILSVTGALRKGKSFLMNFFLRYLKNKGYENDDWIGGLQTKLDDGFDWRGGASRHTKGIDIWSEPFILRKHGHEVAVFVIDTQGSHDLSSGKDECVKVFAITLLLSSVLVFNVRQQIQDDDLEYLHFCVEYSRAAAIQGACGHVPSSEEALLQKLVFLVRDWPFSDFEYGAEGGQKCLDNMIMASNPTNDTTSDEKEYLKGIRDKIECYLMPHPEQKALAKYKPNFHGCLDDLDKDFIAHVSDLASRLLHPCNLEVKNNCSNRSLLDLIVRFCATMDGDQSLPCPKTLLESVAAAHSIDAFIQAVNRYDGEVDKILSSDFVPWDEFDRLENIARRNVLLQCSEMIRFGGQVEKKRILERLEKLLDGAQQRARDRNKMLERMASKAVEELVSGYLSDYRTKMIKFGEACDPDEVKTSIVGEHYNVKREMGVSFKRDVQNIFRDDRVEMEKFNKEIEDAFIVIELEFQHRLAKIKCNLQILIQESVHFYERELCENDRKSALQSTFDYYLENLPPEASQVMVKKTELFLTDLLKKDGDERLKTLAEVEAKIDVLRAGQYAEVKVLGAIADTESSLCTEEMLDQRLTELGEEIMDEFRAVQASHESVEGSRGFEESLGVFINKGFRYARKRNKQYLISLESTLEIDSLIAQVEYSEALQKALNGVYIIPEDLNKFHSRVLIEVLPREIQGISESILARHNKDVSAKLEKTFAQFKEWNLKNKNVFTKIVGAAWKAVADNFDKLGTVALTGTGALKAAGVTLTMPSWHVAGSVVLGCVSVIAVGAAIGYAHKRHNIKKYFKEERENLHKRLKKLGMVNPDH